MDFKEGDRVRIVSRAVVESDELTQMYYSHMGGLVGTVGNVYSKKEISVNIDLDALQGVTADVHTIATKRMRDTFKKNSSEEQKKSLTKEELAFTPNYVLLVAAADLEKIK